VNTTVILRAYRQTPEFSTFSNDPAGDPKGRASLERFTRRVRVPERFPRRIRVPSAARRLAMAEVLKKTPGGPKRPPGE
jgi:hypothetical protein